MPEVTGNSTVIHRLKSVVGEARCRLYDWTHHVSTCGDVAVAKLGDVGGNFDHAAPYAPSHPKFLFDLIARLDIDYPKYDFVDLGSGKGRVLFVASEFPFRRIVGVEFSRPLHDIASRNARQYSSRGQRCKSITLIHGDAIEYEFGKAPTVVFMFNPFRPAVLVPVLRNLRDSIEERPRDALLIYAAPFFGELIERETQLRLVAEERYHNLYRFRPEPRITQLNVLRAD